MPAVYGFFGPLLAMVVQLRWAPSATQCLCLSQSCCCSQAQQRWCGCIKHGGHSCTLHSRAFTLRLLHTIMNQACWPMGWMMARPATALGPVRHRCPGTAMAATQPLHCGVRRALTCHTWHGRTTRLLGSNTCALAPPTTVWLIA
ncbi:hypothetical protein COO60DRAFT_820209 [Scenedesmus sp. NREL 46B-D3]|nr:hypothetical protein COO60DRAFT_820209 [Scenedesmus sp. NREL 46B-D3]